MSFKHWLTFIHIKIDFRTFRPIYENLSNEIISSYLFKSAQENLLEPNPLERPAASEVVKIMKMK